MDTKKIIQWQEKLKSLILTFYLTLSDTYLLLKKNTEKFFKLFVNLKAIKKT